VTLEDSRYGLGAKFAACSVGAREEFWFVMRGELMGWIVFIWDPREDLFVVYVGYNWVWGMPKYDKGYSIGPGGKLPKF
jgi:hypothetical protein